MLSFGFAFLAGGVIGAELRIRSVDEFIQFKDNVSCGTSYYGTTVFLDSDLSLAGKSLEPIGTYYKQFRGVFDGQGHVISNLKMTSSSQYVGLFGFSTGLTIKNVILDSSCSIASLYSGYSPYIGGIIGECDASNGPCTIENSVNMGSVSFSGNITTDSKTAYLGGIAGYLYSYDNDSTVKNCANYGDVTDSGESSYSYIGGIVGYSTGSSSASTRVYIYNSLNHGTITHNGTTINLYLGGIAGYTYRTTIRNCVSGGKFSLPTTASSNNFIGSIVGNVYSDTSISYTYFTSELSGYNKYGYGNLSNESNILSYDSTTFKLNETVSIGNYSGTSLIGALNAYSNYYNDRDYSRWLLNKGSNAVSFTINGRANPIKMDYQIILLPSLANEGNMSFEWFTDRELTTPLTEFEVTKDTELYGTFCKLSNFTVTLDVNGGDELAVKEMTIGCNRVYATLPTPTRTEATFLGWFTERTGGKKVESGDKVTILSDHTLYAHWSINNYTLTFIFDKGTEPEVWVLEFNEAITYPKNVTREGYLFNVWSPKPERMPANDTNTTAQWIEIVPELVEIVIGKKDMTEEEIKEIIKEYTEEGFDIMKIEDDETGGTKVIVKFEDMEVAINFIEKVEASSEGKTLIRKVGFIKEITSFSPAHHPMSLLLLI